MLLQRDSDATHQEPFELHDFRYSRECKCPFLLQQLLLSACLLHEQLANSLGKYLHLKLRNICNLHLSLQWLL